mgnify:CR=1 FL=1
MTAMTPWFLSKFLEGGNRGFKDILEVGALDVSPDGNQDLADFIRRCWPDANYLATDMRGGRNVDVVVNAHNLLEYFGPDKFDSVMCFDMFEHDDQFWVSWENMKAVCKPGGYIILGAPSRHTPLHEHPSDYWRFMKPAFENIFFKDLEDVYIHVFYPVEGSEEENSIFGLGKKPNAL